MDESLIYIYRSHVNKIQSDLEYFVKNNYCVSTYYIIDEDDYFLDSSKFQFYLEKNPVTNKAFLIELVDSINDVIITWNEKVSKIKFTEFEVPFEYVNQKTGREISRWTHFYCYSVSKEKWYPHYVQESWIKSFFNLNKDKSYSLRKLILLCSEIRRIIYVGYPEIKIDEHKALEIPEVPITDIVDEGLWEFNDYFKEGMFDLLVNRIAEFFMSGKVVTYETKIRCSRKIPVKRFMNKLRLVSNSATGLSGTSNYNKRDLINYACKDIPGFEEYVIPDDLENPENLNIWKYFHSSNN